MKKFLILIFGVLVLILISGFAYWKYREQYNKSIEKTVDMASKKNIENPDSPNESSYNPDDDYAWEYWEYWEYYDKFSGERTLTLYKPSDEIFHGAITITYLEHDNIFKFSLISYIGEDPFKIYKLSLVIDEGKVRNFEKVNFDPSAEYNTDYVDLNLDEALNLLKEMKTGKTLAIKIEAEFGSYILEVSLKEFDKPFDQFAKRIVNLKKANK